MAKKKSSAGENAGTAVIDATNDPRVQVVQHPENEPVPESEKPLPHEFKKLKLASVVEGSDKNTRPVPTKDSVAELMGSMAKQGLLHPITVTPAGEPGLFRILAGRRRLCAATHLGWAYIDACVLTGGAARALEIMLTENLQRAEPDPLREADVIDELLERPNWTYRDVAAALGASETWVARRARLRTLSKPARAAVLEHREEDPTSWPVSWLEELALAADAAQDDIVDSYIRTFADLQRAVRSAMGSLGAAPWPLEDATITKAGACTTCKKHSAAEPSLFPEESALHEIKGALCLDTDCFALKRAAWTKRRAAELKASEGKDVLLVHGVRWDSQGKVENSEFGKGVKIAEASAYTPTSKEQKGAKPALIVDGPKAGQLVYVRKSTGHEGMDTGPARAASAPKSKPKKGADSAPKKSLAERRADLELRRKRHAFAEFCAEVEELAKGGAEFKALAAKLSDEDVLRLVAAFCVKGNNPHANSIGGPAKVRTVVLEHVVDEMRLQHFKLWMASASNAKTCMHDVGTYLDIVGGERTVEMRLAAARDAIPEPASWTAEKAAAKASMPKATKSAKRKKAK